MLSHYYSIRTVSSMTTSNLVFKRNMHLAKHVAKNYLLPKSHSVLPSTRHMASMHGGRMKKNHVPLHNTQGKQPESDLTGQHQLVFASVCSKPGCKDQNCATETKLSTGNHQSNPCGESTQYHQKPVIPHPVIKQELVGNTTSGAPSNKKEVTIDGQKQINGNQQAQKLVLEKNTVQVPPGSFNENKKTTAYLQEDDRTQTLISALPADSAIK
jgi:hypothetical protein